MQHSLSSISLSPLTPYQFVVAGESPYVRVGVLSTHRRTHRDVLEHRATCSTEGKSEDSSNTNGGCHRTTIISLRVCDDLVGRILIPMNDGALNT